MFTSLISQNFDLPNCLNLEENQYLDPLDHFRQSLLEGRLAPPLLKLLRLLGCEAQTLKEALSYTQKNWLRKEGIERWQMENWPQVDTYQVLQCLKELGLLEVQQPLLSKYEYAILPGAYGPKMAERLSFFCAILKKNPQIFQKVVLLASQRPLLPQRDFDVLHHPSKYGLELCPSFTESEVKHLKETLKTEQELLEVLYSRLDLPPHLKNAQKANAPLLANGARPGHAQCFQAWLKQFPKQGSCLFISNQPYILHGEINAKIQLDGWPCVHSCGPEIDTNATTLAIHLDNVARILYAATALNEKS